MGPLQRPNESEVLRALLSQHQENEVFVPTSVSCSKTGYMVDDGGKVGGAVELHTIQASIVCIQDTFIKYILCCHSLIFQ